MLSFNTIVVFASASFILTITPGPDIIYVITCGIAQGKRAGFLAALGFSIGVIVHTTFAVVGLSALISSSAFVFQVVKYAGALYFVYLGIKLFTAKSNFLLQQQQDDKLSLKIFWQSIVANVLNPKVTLFFLAFLPQFVNFTHGKVAMQMLLLGGIFMLVTFSVFSFVGYFASSIGNWLRKKPRLANKLHWVAGCVFIGLGIRVALLEHR
ncbi:LysE family translocator [Scytonema sp. UIC 10036]|uniref:LysE family translocator n=1 Tax=Scytonema sp. UIC 10036 TaxID=2304196 RepID=UPI0012DAC662|nr:LysE family translocator [Scytonema sp. UIC 10036]MUG92159.1 LysE family translocator [Scytonema sp. UIC 10036]